MKSVEGQAILFGLIQFNYFKVIILSIKYVKSKTLFLAGSNRIVSKDTVADGNSFVLKCDSSLAGVPEKETQIVSLEILWKYGNKDPKSLVLYRRNSYPFTTRVSILFEANLN